jgi:hypothetical protein
MLRLLVPLAYAAGPKDPPSPAAMGVFALLGLFPIVAAWQDWDWFFEHRKARFFVQIFGRGGARVFYAILGCVIVAGGLMGAMVAGG